MSPAVAQGIVAGGILLVFFALCACALIPDPEERQRKEELKRKREEAQQRRQLEAEEARKKLIARGKHIHQIPLSSYKPSSAYLAPARKEEPIPANVQSIRRKAK